MNFRKLFKGPNLLKIIPIQLLVCCAPSRFDGQRKQSYNREGDDEYGTKSEYTYGTAPL